MWQQILKAELASQSGYAQLDFDNIVEEEEANCKQKLKELSLKLENIRLEVADEKIPILIADSFDEKSLSLIVNETKPFNG